jgi:hypothetical protein
MRTFPCGQLVVWIFGMRSDEFLPIQYIMIVVMLLCFLFAALSYRGGILGGGDGRKAMWYAVIFFSQYYPKKVTVLIFLRASDHFFIYSYQ